MAWFVVRRGITRTVLVTKRYAIKLPSLRPYGEGLAGVLWSFSRGVLANQSERTWWENETPENKAKLCPVLRSHLGGIVQVYPRCEPLPVDEQGEYDGDLPILVPNPGDDKPGNFGLLAGRIVRIDYDMSFNGCPHDRSGARQR